ncbi:MAG: HAD family hydrolase, partial [Bacteroidia bacterium]
LSKVGLLSAFDAIVDANQVVNGKPHPETFNKAADMLNMAPHECIVFEDSVSGIQAAKTAEMYSIGVGNPSDLEWADEFVTSLGEYDFHHFE